MTKIGYLLKSISVWMVGTFLSVEAQNVLPPIPLHIEYNYAKAKLGKRLFFDPKLSDDGTVSCAQCHQPQNGAEKRSVSIGIRGRKGHTNAQTIFNSVFNFRQMWNGEATNLKDQVRLPIHNPNEMAMDSSRIVRYLRRDPSYSKLFLTLYHRPATFEDMSDAIAEFEKALTTPNSRFDRYLRHETTLTPLELQGYKLFKKIGCITCHNGINLGGNSFQKIGLINPYPWRPYNPDLYALTHRENDKNVYKVPTLRNIALTAPYFHDGSVPTLREALRKMAYHNLGFVPNDEEIRSLIAFLKTLTGETPQILHEKKH
ncbi:cytochrome-c peroxidase [Nitratifractor sp.]